ncbi:MAG: DUF4349 domain-containing protein [Defluviitaleaceae bacterium]|nr:DUF4349 domain-containing protein [Defluviitaleaceae bacterium]
MQLIKTLTTQAVIAAFLLVIFFTSTAAAPTEPSDFLANSYAVSLNVEDLENAFNLLNAMDGLVLGSSMNAQHGFGSLTLVVDSANFNSVYSQIVNIGEITNVNTNSQNLFMRLSNLQTELEMFTNEQQQIMQLLLAAEALDDFSVLSRHLSQVTANVENTQTAINRLNFMLNTTEINISINTPTANIQATGFFANVSNSVGYMFVVLEFLIIGIIYLSIPAAILAVFAVLILRIRKKFLGKNNKNNPNKFNHTTPRMST